ncbi:hypothetical protein HZB96_00400 [Candidatus Gottesmanbacteria bacterium]|nr:hypothetical protein [Candidatus Gottesmanbacteria bacterium]
MSKKVLKVGLDFDGVVAYNPFRIVRAPITFLKRNILGIRKLQFWYPRRYWQQIFWQILHESSIFPAKGVDLLEKLVKEKNVEAHLVTARYSFLDDHLYNWLDKYGLRKLFKTVNLNKKDEQPHVFKEKIIKKHNLDVFIEDNLDIVAYLHGKGKTKIFWIYNLLDRFQAHPYKFPYLEKALEEIMRKSKIQSSNVK